MVGCIWNKLNYVVDVSRTCNDPIRVFKPERVAHYNKSKQSFDDFIWFLSNGKVSKRNWLKYQARHNLSDQSGLDPNQLPTMASPTAASPAPFPPNFTCLIFRADFALRFNYVTQNDTIKEELFHLSTDEVRPQSKSCHTRRILWTVASDGIELRFQFARYVGSKYRLSASVAVVFNTDNMMTSKRFTDFKSLHTRESSGNCFRFGEFYLNHPFWCPMTQSFERNVNNHNVISLNISNILFDSFRDNIETKRKFKKRLTKPIDQVFNCVKQWSPFLDNNTDSWPAPMQVPESSARNDLSAQLNITHSILDAINFYVLPVLFVIVFAFCLIGANYCKN